MKTRKFFLLSAMMLALTACGDDKKVDMGNNSTIPTKTIAESTSTPMANNLDLELVEKYGKKLAPFAKQEWNEHFDVLVNDTPIKIHIDLQTSVAPAVDKVIHCIGYDCSEESKKYFVESYLGNETVYCNDPEYYPTDKLDCLIEAIDTDLTNLKKQLDEAKNNNEPSDTIKSIEKTIDETSADKKKYIALKETAPANWVPMTNYNLDSFCTITADGKECKVITFVPQEDNSYLNFTFTEPSNDFSMTKDNMIDYVNHMIDKAGLSPIEITTFQDMYDYTGEYYMYGRISIANAAPDEIYTTNFTYASFTDNTITIDQYDPLYIYETTDDVSLLALDEIKKIINNALPSCIEEQIDVSLLEDDSYIKITDLKLILVFDHNNHCFVPAWKLSWDAHFYGNSPESAMEQLYINAIDGSIV